MKKSSRRSFLWRSLALSVVGVCSACGIPSASRQPATRTPRIGYLVLGSGSRNFEPFRDGLAELGYVDGRTVVIERRIADSTDQFPSLVAELVQLPVDVILAAGTAPLQAAMTATRTIPIVFPIAGDPVANGFVASLARPGGNVTGLTDLATQAAGKRLQLLREMVPAVSRIAFLADAANWEATGFRGLREIQESAQPLGITVLAPEIRTVADFPPAFESARRDRVDAVMLSDSPLLTEGSGPIIEFVTAARLPVMSQTASFPRAGALSGYGANIGAMYRRSATFVDKILKGASPADLPVEQVSEFDFVINMRTAQALGLTIPPTVLAQATELIQ